MQQNTNVDSGEQAQSSKKELQAALQALDEQTINILESITDAFLVIDRDWRFIYVNSQAELLMQKTRKELLGQTAWKLYPEVVGTSFYHEFRRAMAQKVTVHFEEFYRPLNTWFEVRIYPAVDGLSVYLRDISDRKQAEEALHQREQAFRALAENSPDIIARFDKQLRHLYVNAAVEPVMGLSPQAFIGKTIRELGMPKALCDYWEECFQQVFATGVERTLEFQFPTPDGTTRTYQSRFVPEFANDGSVEYVLAVAHDVTDFKQTEKALRESQQFLQAILDAAPQIIYLKDLQGRYLLLNHYCERLNHLSPEQLIDKTDDECFEPEIAETFRANDRAVLEAGKPLEIEEILPQADGPRTFISTKFPLYDSSGVPYAICGISTDITERKQAEEALHRREQEFRALVENSPDIITRVDRQQRYLYVNAAVEATTGISPQDHIGKTNRDLGMPEALCVCWEENLQQVFITGEERIIEFDYTTSEGTTRYYQTRLVPEFALDGSVETILTIDREVTDFKQTEAALKESEERFRQLAENINAVFWMYSLDEHKTFYLSPAIEKIWGRSLQFVYDNPQNWIDTIHPEDRAHMVSIQKQLNQGKLIDEVYRIVKPDGSIRWIHDRAFPVYDSQGRLYRFAGIAFDISDRKQTEAALKESEQKYRNLVETSQGFIWSVDRKGRITFVNQAVRQIYGYEPEEMIGRYCTEFTTPQQGQKNREMLKRVLLGESCFQYETAFLRKDGTPLWISTNAIALRDNTGKLLGATGTAVEISDRIRAEEELKTSLQEKEALLKEVHHRVKNNLQVISSLLDLQAERIQEPSALEAFRVSQNRIKSIALIHEKLYQSKNLAKVNMADYIDILTSHLLQTYLINSNDITLQLDVDDIFLSADTLIPCGLIINELVTNALKYAFPGNRSAEINVKLACVSPNQYVLTVRDNGIGLPEDIDLRQTKSLGLQLVYRLTQQLQGTIDLERNKGSVFKITFTENS